MVNDTQVLQCVAENKYGQIFTNVILDIQRKFDFKNRYKNKHSYLFLSKFTPYFLLADPLS